MEPETREERRRRRAEAPRKRTSSHQGENIFDMIMEKVFILAAKATTSIAERLSKTRRNIFATNERSD